MLKWNRYLEILPVRKSPSEKVGVGVSDNNSTENLFEEKCNMFKVLVSCAVLGLYSHAQTPGLRSKPGPKAKRQP